MRRSVGLTALAVAAAAIAGTAPPAVETQKQYYDPGATPMPPQTIGRAGKSTVAKFTRQLVRSIRRELTGHSFSRALLQAVSLGFPVETPPGRVPVTEENWRKIWLAQLDQAIAASKRHGGDDA